MTYDVMVACRPWTQTGYRPQGRTTALHFVITHFMSGVDRDTLLFRKVFKFVECLGCFTRRVQVPIYYILRPFNSKA